MAHPGVVGVAGLSFVAGAVYAGLARHSLRRAVSPDARRANALFALWWGALAAAMTALGCQEMLGVFADADAGVPLALATLTEYVYLLALSVALWGLLAYLWFLFTGRDATVGIGVAYAFVFAAACASLSYQGVAGLRVTDFTAEVRYARGLGPFEPFVLLLFTAAFLLPQIGAAVGYLSLLPRIEDRAARRRIVALGVGLPVWLGATIVATALDAQHSDAWLVGNQALGLAVALVIAWSQRA